MEGKSSFVDEQLVRLLFTEDETNDIDPEYEEYLGQLTTFGLEKILKEPEILKHESNRIKRTIENEVFENYKSFIQTNECIHHLREYIDSIGGEVEAMTTNLPTLTTSCSEFVEKSKEIDQERMINKTTLARHTQILELLEVPQLMETCVRNAYYEEALQIHQFSQQISRRYPHIPLIQNITEDVNKSTDIMIAQLHQKLKGNIQVTACLRVIGFLRQLEIYNESQLRISFLKSRDFWLISQIEQISTQNPYSYLSKYIDLTRSNLFDIITQFRAIFSDTPDHSNPRSFTDGEILLSWMTHKIQNLIHQMETQLPKISDGSAIYNLLDQSMYLGMSLSRVGLDFRGLLPPIFENHIFSLFAKVVSSGTSQFLETIKSQKIAYFPSKVSNPLVERSSDKLAANTSLLEIPALATLTNVYLTAMNELRVCAPVTLIPRFTQEIENSFSQIAFGLKAHKAMIKSSEEEAFSALVKKTYEIFFPYVEKCFNHIFHSANSSLLDINNYVEILQSIY